VHLRERHDFNGDLRVVQFLHRDLQDAIVFQRLASWPIGWSPPLKTQDR
jgi:hypothetical protein